MGGKPEYLHTPLTLAQTETNSRISTAKKIPGGNVPEGTTDLIGLKLPAR